MTTYRSTERYEMINLSQEEVPDWGIPASMERPESGLVAVRNIGSPSRVVFIGSAEDAAVQFEPVE